MIIYHVTTQAEWLAALEKGAYEAPSLFTEGFIHCSQDHQVSGVLERYFKNKTDLVKLVVDTERLTSELRLELAPSVNEMFPHVYGSINIAAVTEVVQL